jgi:hypothetical protein
VNSLSPEVTNLAGKLDLEMTGRHGPVRAHCYTDTRSRRPSRHPSAAPGAPARGRKVRSMAARNTVDAPETAVNGSYPQAGREVLPVSDVGRLLLHSADRPGLVAAVTTFLAQAGANIVSLDQHATEQSGGSSCSAPFFTCRDCRPRATRWNVTSPSRWPPGSTCISRSPRQPNPNESRSWHPKPTTASWTFCGATVAVNWI